MLRGFDIDFIATFCVFHDINIPSTHMSVTKGAGMMGERDSVAQ